MTRERFIGFVQHPCHKEFAKNPRWLKYRKIIAKAIRQRGQSYHFDDVRKWTKTHRDDD